MTLAEEDITEICTNARKPGGTIANPVHNPSAVVAGVPPTIPNPGVLIGHIFEKKIEYVALLHTSSEKNSTKLHCSLCYFGMTCYCLPLQGTGRRI